MNKKGVMFSMDDSIVQKLKILAEKNSSSMSHEVRRLILHEYEQVIRERKKNYLSSGQC